MSFKKPFFFFQYLLVVLFTSMLYAEGSKNSVEVQIIEKITTSIFPDQKVTAWGETVELKNTLHQSKKIDLVENFNNARILFVAKKIPENIPSNTIIIATNYSLLIKDKRVVGAFFWQKGRPNLLFLRKRMQIANITLDHEFEKYIEDDL
ncbi:MAG: hypothetical protein PHU29_06800 [Sulfuricurvum sp.]|uniref:hypothetical protein n=1 Tax=Sulfuricurvum sp. TaxID=2025608 RepID=UPI002601F730|nr:hypothetical protein [Sulfuricurvum sp.]MDD2950479.1 hypothetical protein [Sulfuricurvum sp.]MDD5118240.1 hypothetical protein [Sulfuricurvum sp.]